MSGTAAIVPFRGLERGKQRLRPLFDDGQRATLTRRMLGDVVQSLVTSGVVSDVGVVTLDAQVAPLLRPFGPCVEMVAQAPDQPGLIGGLDAGLAWARGRGMSGLLVVSADLPMLTNRDLQQLAARDAAVVIAPDRHLSGTNALLLRLDSLPRERSFRFKFGIESYVRHVAEAERQGVEIATSLATGTMFDLDTPEDWRDLPFAVRSRLIGGDVLEGVSPGIEGIERECARCL